MNPDPPLKPPRRVAPVTPRTVPGWFTFRYEMQTELAAEEVRAALRRIIADPYRARGHVTEDTFRFVPRFRHTAITLKGRIEPIADGTRISVRAYPHWAVYVSLLMAAGFYLSGAVPWWFVVVGFVFAALGFLSGVPDSFERLHEIETS